jgi:immune inhibitor A
MKNCAIVAIIILFVVLDAMAIPARRNTIKEVTLSDGTKVMAILRGDENGHWWETSDGTCLLINDKNEATILSNFQMKTKRQIASRKKNMSNSVRMTRAKDIAPTGTSYSGTKRGLVILVNFKNKNMISDSSSEYFNRQFNEKGFSENNHIGSVRDYFYDQSYGQLDIVFDVVGPVTVSQNYSYYGQNDSNGDDKHPCAMVIEACQLADSFVDFSDYDWNDDGEVDQIYIVYAGFGENAGAVSSTIWPHEWTLEQGASYGDGSGAITLDGVKIDTYAVSSELAGSSGKTINGIGTACHEFSHCLGFPDFYDTSGNNEGWGMDAWDIMCSGSYNGPNYIGEIPCGYTSYERWVAGWLQPTELTLGMEVTGQKSLATDPEAYIVYNEKNNNEYYLLENRQSSRWFSYVSDYKAPSGLLILHVDYDAEEWTNNTPNAVSSHQRMTIFQANNDLGALDANGYYITESQYRGHLYPYNSNDSLTNTSIPAATVYNAQTDGSKFMNKGIHNIKKNSDGTISYVCFNSSISQEGGEDQGNEPTPDGDYIFYESFDDCDGKGGNDGLWSGSIASAAFLPDNDGWDGSKMYGAYKCAKFGSSKYVGQVSSPAFTLNGEATLSFLAGSWDSSKDGTSVDVYLGSQLLNSYDIPRGQWTEITTDITGHGKTLLTFVPDLRFFLDEVKIVPKTTNGIKDAVLSEYNKGHVYSITGQYLGTNLNLLPQGIYIYNGRKYIKK